jgi:hypothetical protein
MKTDKDILINVFGCYRCGQLAGDLRRKFVTETRQGYEICPLCHADLDNFWINLTNMSSQESRVVSISEMNRLADQIGGSFKPTQRSELNVLVDSVVGEKEISPKSWWRKDVTKLPKLHGNKKWRTEFTKGTGFHGKTASQIRKMAKKSSRNLVKALKKK